MTDTGTLALSILRALDIAVLIRERERHYALYGQPSPIFFSLFPDLGQDGLNNFWNEGHPLGRFLTDAETFFANNAEGGLTSGLMRFDDEALGNPSLVAGALCLGDRQVLTLRLVPREMADTACGRPKGRESIFTPLEANAPDARNRFDSLSLLRNRESFLETLRELIAGVTDYGDLSLLLLDIDDFSGLNEVFGQEQGDAVIAALGTLLRTFLRTDDLAARYAGGRFAVLAPYTMQHQAVRMAEKLRAATAENDFGSLPLVTVSIGCATHKKGESPDAFIARAELALKDAKKSGKNLVRMR